MMNQATRSGMAGKYRDLLTDSDIALSPQALVLSPASTLRIASAIVRETTPYAMTIAAAREAVALIDESTGSGFLRLVPREEQWLRKIAVALDELPAAEGELMEEMRESYGTLFTPASYGL
jgi:methanol--5-hydroxybenzimidazolylcobamide Co-methyltransferase